MSKNILCVDPSGRRFNASIYQQYFRMIPESLIPESFNLVEGKILLNPLILQAYMNRACLVLVTNESNTGFHVVPETYIKDLKSYIQAHKNVSPWDSAIGFIKASHC